MFPMTSRRRIQLTPLKAAIGTAVMLTLFGLVFLVPGFEAAAQSAAKGAAAKPFVTDAGMGIIMLVLFLFFLMLGFPIAFTLMAMGVGFGYYA